MVPTANIYAKTCRHKALNAVVILNEIKKFYGPKTKLLKRSFDENFINNLFNQSIMK